VEQTVKSISKNLYVRGKGGMKYCRRRIPAALREAYPKNQTRVVCSLGTSDLKEAKITSRPKIFALKQSLKKQR